MISRKKNFLKNLVIYCLRYLTLCELYTIVHNFKEMNFIQGLFLFGFRRSREHKVMSSSSSKLPIVYHDNYNIHLYGLENILHSFDTKKYGKIFDSLSKEFDLSYENFYHPSAVVSQEDLLLVHTQEYLNRVDSSSTEIAKICEVPFLAAVPIFLGRARLLEPMKLATQGTVLAAQLALQYGWSINLSGGYHHAKASGGEGFCIYADTALAIRKLMGFNSDMTLKETGDLTSALPTELTSTLSSLSIPENEIKIKTLFTDSMEGNKENAENCSSLPISSMKRVNKVLIIDLDAHQGNGYQSLFTKIDKKKHDELSYSKLPSIQIFDMYNSQIYPNDRFAKHYIDYDLPLRSRISTAEYLTLLRSNLSKALRECQPDIIFYNAGTDIFEEDPLGAMSISEAGIIERDEYVFAQCKEHGNIPVVMVLSGGYTKQSASIISQSIKNLITKKIINLPSGIIPTSTSSSQEHTN
jgi:acetoin utilization deacetylase AcuC-like enzyme